MNKNTQLQTRKFKLNKQNKWIIDIHSNFFEIIDDSAKDVELNNIFELIREYCENKTFSIDNALSLGISDAIEASIYNAMRNIVQEHENFYYEANQLTDSIKERLKKAFDKIDNMHSYEITDGFQDFDLNKSDEGDYIAYSEFQIAGVRKSIEFNLKDFYSIENQEIYRQQLYSLLKEILLESPYNLLDLLHVEL